MLVAQPINFGDMRSDYGRSAVPTACGSTLVDTQCALELPREVSPSGAAQPLYLVRDDLMWQDGTASGAQWFNLYRGDIAMLGSGDYGDCIQPDLPSPSTTDALRPMAPGEVWIYHVTGENAVGEGPLGFIDNPSAARPNLRPCN